MTSPADPLELKPELEDADTWEIWCWVYQGGPGYHPTMIGSWPTKLQAMQYRPEARRARLVKVTIRADQLIDL